MLQIENGILLKRTSNTREKLGNEYWDPIQFDDGSSSDAWLKKHKYGI